MKRPLLCMALCLLTVGLLTSALPVAAQDDYTVTAKNTVDVPTQEFKYNGQTHKVSSVGVVAPDGTLTVLSTGPSKTTYNLQIFNNNYNRENMTSDLSGEEVTDFDIGSDMSSEVGTYIVVLNTDERQADIQPVIVEGYNLEVTVPDDVVVGETAEISVDVTRQDATDKSLHAIEVVLTTDDTEQVVTAVDEGDSYTATVEFKQSTEYTVYAGARGEERIGGENELLGVSNPQTINSRKEEPATETVDSQPGDGNQDDDAEVTEQPTDEPSTAVPNSEPSPDIDTESNDTAMSETTPTEIQSTATEGSDMDKPTTTATNPASETRVSTASTQTDSDIVTPALTMDKNETTDTTTTTGTGPTGLSTILTALVILFGSMRLWRRT